MKIMLCGKGGCGKSTISTMLARAYKARGKNVLVIDTDESNFGLHKQLGAELPKDFTQYFGGKRGVLKTRDAHVLFEEKLKINEIPAEYVTESDGVKLLAIGKIHEAGEGCACGMGVLAREFLPALDLSADDVVIIDSEAGIEHFGRGVDAHVDVILMVVDPSYESIHMSEKILEMGNAIGKPVWFILNKTDAEKEEVMRVTITNPDHILTALPSDKDVMIKGLKGEKLDVILPQIEEICEKIG